MQTITSSFAIEIYSGSTTTWVDYTGYVLAGTLNIDHELNTRSICAFNLHDDDGAMVLPSAGQRVRITDGDASYFGGLITEVEYEAFRPMGTVSYTAKIKAADWSCLLDRFYVTATYEGQTLKQIVTDIVAQMDTLDALDTTNVETGPTLSKVVFPTITGQQALDELMRETGFKYWVTYDKKLHVQDRFSTAASWNLTNLTSPTRTVGVPVVKRDLSQYRNVQEIKGGSKPDDAESYYPAATQGGLATIWAIDTTGVNPLTVPWDLGRVVDNIGRVYISAVPLPSGDFGSVYLCGTAAGGQEPFYAIPGGRYLYVNESWQENGTTRYWWELFPAAQYRYVRTYGKFRSEGAAIARKTAAWCSANGETETDTIAQMAAIEGGSGIYHKIEVNERLSTIEECQARANALLKQYGVVPTIVDYTTDDWDDLMVGQYQNVTIYGLSKDCVVKSMKISDVAGKWLRAQVQLVGSERQSYAQYWRQVLSGQTQGMTHNYAVRATEIATQYTYLPDENIEVDDTSLVATEVDAFSDWGDGTIGGGAEWA